MAFSATQIRRGMVLVFENDPCRVVEFRHHTPGNLRAMVQAKLKNLRSGNNFEHRFRADDQIHKADMETQELQFLYKSGETYHFMNTDNYEQLEMDEETLGDNAPWMQDNMMVMVEFYNGRPMSVQLPQFLNLTITETAPVMKTATKTATPSARIPTRRRDCRGASRQWRSAKRRSRSVSTENIAGLRRRRGRRAGGSGGGRSRRPPRYG